MMIMKLILSVLLLCFCINTAHTTGYSLEQDTVTGTEGTHKYLKELTVTAKTVKMTGPGSYRLTPLPEQKRLASNLIQVISNMNLSILDIDEGTNTVKMSNGESCTIYINGIAATPQEIQGMLPSMIRFVELLDHPTDPRFQGNPHVLNFVLRDEIGGFTKISGKESFMNGNLTYAGIFNHLVRKRLAFSLYAGGTYRDIPRGGSDNEETIKGRTLIQRSTSVDEFNAREWNIPLSARLTYTSHKFIMNHTLGFSHDRTPYSRISGSNTYPFSSVAIEEPYDRNMSEKSNVTSWGAMYYFIFPKYLSLNIVTTLNYSHNNSRNAYLFPGGDIINLAKEDALSYNITAVLSKWFGYRNNLTLTAGFNDVMNKVDYYQGKGKNCYNFPGGTLMLSHTLNLSRLRFMTLVGGEVNSYRTRHDGINEEYTEFKPVLGINFNLTLGNSALSGYLQYKQGGLSYSAFTPDTIRQDEILYIAGNPDIKVEKTLMGNISWNWNATEKLSISPSVSYLCYYDRILREYSAYGDGILRRFGNVGEFQDLDARITAALNILGGKLSLRGNVGIERFFSSRTHLDGIDAFYGSLSATCRVGDFRFLAEYDSPRRSLSSVSGAKTEIPSAYSLGASWFRGAWTLGLTLDNIFRTSWKTGKSILLSPVYDVRRTEWGIDRHACCTLTASFNFGYGKKTKPENELGRAAYGNSSILKD